MLKKLCLGACMLFTTQIYASQNFYVGVSGGLSRPLKSSFKVKAGDSEYKVPLSNSFMFTLEGGYQFSEGMDLNGSIDFKPNYKMKVKIPDFTDGGNTIKLGEVSTKVKANVFMLGVRYKLQHLVDFCSPYVIGGMGVAKLKIKDAKKEIPTLPAPLNALSGQTAFALKNNNPTSFAWQAGLGLGIPVHESVSFDISAKLQVVHDIKINFEYFDTKSNSVKKESAKRTLGVAEIQGGLIFRF